MTDAIQFMDETRQGVAIVHVLNQRLIDPVQSEALTQHLCSLIDGATASILIDLGAVGRMSSVFFRSFIIAGKKANEAKTIIAFYNLPAVIREGFVITGLDKLFKIYASEGKALGELGEK